MLLLYEDVHWIDPTSQELLDLVVRRLAGEAVMTVVTTRQEEVSAWPDLSYVNSLRLARLSQQDAAIMARNLVSDLALSSTSVANIVAENGWRAAFHRGRADGHAGGNGHPRLGRSYRFETEGWR